MKTRLSRRYVDGIKKEGTTSGEDSRTEPIYRRRPKRPGRRSLEYNSAFIQLAIYHHRKYLSGSDSGGIAGSSDLERNVDGHTANGNEAIL